MIRAQIEILGESWAASAESPTKALRYLAVSLEGALQGDHPRPELVRRALADIRATVRAREIVGRLAELEEGSPGEYLPYLAEELEDDLQDGTRTHRVAERGVS